MPLPESPGQPHGRVLLVTGAAGGIGRAVVKRALQEGYRVFAIDRVDAPEAERDDPRLRWFHADVTREDQIEAAYLSLAGAWNQLDAAVLAAGAVGAGRAEAVAAAEFRRLIELNLTSAFNCARLALPALRESRGCLVFMSSTNGLTGGSPLSGPAYPRPKPA